MNIEEIAHSVFENASQEPPKEVWEGIEAKLHGSSAVSKVGKRRWIWTAGAGAVVAAALAFATSIYYSNSKNNHEPVAQLTNIDSIVEVPIDARAGDIQKETVGDDSFDSEAVNNCHSVASTNKTINTNGGEARKETVKVSSGTSDGKMAVVSNATSRSNSSNTNVAKTEVTPVEDDQDFDLLEYQLLSHEYDIPSDSRSQVKKTDSKSAEQSEKPQATKAEDPAINIPNIVSPNGDGYNDCWRIPDLARYGKASVQIFTARSKRVYSSDDYRGEFCGDDLPSGNYFYVLTIRHLNYTRRGVLVIKR